MEYECTQDTFNQQHTILFIFLKSCKIVKHNDEANKIHCNPENEVNEHKFSTHDIRVQNEIVSWIFYDIDLTSNLQRAG